MSNIYYDVRVDIQKDIVIDSGLRFTQGDSKVIYLRIAVMNGGVEFDASNTIPSVNFVKPDGTYVTGTPVKSGNFWIYQILGNELQKAGKVLCDIKFTYESGRVSSSKFTFIVEKDTTISDAEASSSYILPMEELLREMQNYKNQGVSIVEASAVNATEAKQGATDAKNEADRAKDEADKAAAIVGIEIANTTTAGIVKIPTDGSITIDSDGTIHSNGGSTFDVMKKSVYDADDDGIVDLAKNANEALNANNAEVADNATHALVSEKAWGLESSDGTYKVSAKEAKNIYDCFHKEGTDLKLSDNALSSAVTTKLSKLNSDGTLDFSNVGSKPTTLSGYGITDAYTKTEVDNKLDSWHKYNGSIEENTVNTTNTDETITFHSIDTSKAYELWFDTSDGQQATVKSSLISGTDITYTVNTPTAGTKFRLLVKGI